MDWKDFWINFIVFIVLDVIWIALFGTFDGWKDLIRVFYIMLAADQVAFQIRDGEGK